MSEPVPQVSVIIVTHNSARKLPECLSALRRALDGISSQVIAVDNASTDLTLTLLRREWPSARVLANDRNRGFGAAANRGAAEAAGEYLLFLNPDVTVDSDAVVNLIAAARVDPRAGLVAGRLRFPDGRFQATCRKFPTPGNVFQARGAVTAKLFRGGNGYTLPDYEETTEVPAVAGTLVMVNRKLFEALGGFDRRFFMYLEDTDLSLRAVRTGFRNLFVPSAGGVHYWGEGSTVGRVRRLYHHHISVWRYFLKHVPNGFSVVVLPVLLLLNFMLRLLIPGSGAGEKSR